MIEMLLDKNRADVPSTKGISISIYILTVLIFFAKHLRHIVLILAGISAALAAYDLMTGNIGWGVVEVVLTFGGIIFLIQLKQNRR